MPAILLAAGGGLAWWMVARAPFARTYASMPIGEAGSLEACQTRDGGYIFIGHTDPSGAELEDALVIKTNSRGKPVWSRTFGGGSSDSPLSVHETGDGGYIIAGCTRSFGQGETDAWLIRIDSQGNELWSRTFGGPGVDCAQCSQPTPDGGYVVVGGTTPAGADFEDAWLIKTDSSGNLVWSRTFGGSYYDHANCVLVSSDGGYVLAGVTDSDGAGWTDAWLIKTDAWGNQAWSRAFGGASDDHVVRLLQTLDGGYIMAGHTKSYGAGSCDGWLVKTDAGGNQTWACTYGGAGEDHANGVVQTADGGYVLAGWTYSSGAGDKDAWLVRTDARGRELWSRTLGGKEDDWAGPISPTSDGGFVITAWISSRAEEGMCEAFMIKASAGGRTPGF